MADCANKLDDEAREAEFVRLLTSHQLDIYLYVHSLMSNSEEAADIVQETNTVLWAKRNLFQIGTEFRAWAFQIARYELAEHRAERKRRGLCFSDALVDELALRAPRHAHADDDLMDELRRCVAQLTTMDRELLSRRYALQSTCEAIAKSLSRPIRWVHNTLSRIRQELRTCVAQHADTRREQ